MKHLKLIGSWVLLIFIITGQLFASESDRHPSRIIAKAKLNVKLDVHIRNGKVHTGIPELDRLNDQNGCREMKQLIPETSRFKQNAERFGLTRIFTVSFHGEKDIPAVIETYRKSGLFEYVEPDYIGSGGGQANTTPNDTYFYRQWSLVNTGAYPTQHPGTADADIDMDEAWDIEQGSSSVVFGILDSGIKLDHPEFSGRLWQNNGETAGNGTDDDNNGYADDINGWNMAYATNDPTDDLGHGSNVGGIVAANGNNGTGYAGIDWNCKIMVLKILNDQNWGYYSWWTEAITYAVNNGANVLNMSVGGSSFSQSMKDAVDYAHANNVTIVACMMNENNNVPYYPAAFANTIAVGATDTDDSRCNPFSWGGGSNFGPHIDLSAPGNYIYGLNHTDNNNYNWYWGGTSQATPHVSGVACLMLAQNPNLTPEQIRTLLRNSAEDQVGPSNEDTPGWDQYFGAGRLNARAALAAVTTVTDREPQTAGRFVLYQNYPNPFNPKTTVRFEIKTAQIVRINIYDIVGRKLLTLAERRFAAGEHLLQWNAVEFASGIYYIELRGDNRRSVRKAVLLK